MELYNIGYVIGIMIGVILALILILGPPILFIIGLVQSFRRKTKGWVILTCLMGVVLLMPVVAFSYGLFKAASSHHKSSPKQKVPANREIISEDGLCKLTIPSHWVLLEDLNEEASIQVGNLQQEQYLIVFTDLKEDFDGTFEDHADFTSSKLIRSIEKGQKGEPETLEISGYKAIRYNITGSVNRSKLIYLHTTFEGERGYHQVLAWTVPSQAEVSLNVFEDVLRTFEEIPEQISYNWQSD